MDNDNKFDDDDVMIPRWSSNDEEEKNKFTKCSRSKHEKWQISNDDNDNDDNEENESN